jgi:hypothetical protein
MKRTFKPIFLLLVTASAILTGCAPKYQYATPKENDPKVILGRTDDKKILMRSGSTAFFHIVSYEKGDTPTCKSVVRVGADETRVPAGKMIGLTALVSYPGGSCSPKGMVIEEAKQGYTYFADIKTTTLLKESYCSIVVSEKSPNIGSVETVIPTVLFECK